ncbi:MAG: Fe(2+)-trafficking protein [Aridibacter famidurans]|nr:Fe(2+)-trafficking protein [Aridibacter famidurans]QQS42764.1 MAG: Fe(2+)-trafficking protein [Acidobacteriota bacterium]
MAIFSSDKFECARCGRKTKPIGSAPIPTDLGQRIGSEICGECWSEWLEKQKQIINHFGLDLSNPDAHEYLFDQMKLFFFNEGENLAEIDTSKEGSVSW